jgi:hypothetical protein
MFGLPFFFIVASSSTVHGESEIRPIMSLVSPSEKGQSSSGRIWDVFYPGDIAIYILPGYNYVHV